MENIYSATYKNMGIRCAKNVANHILLENTYENNLVSDISTVDYLSNNNGRTNLQPLEGLPTFVDDLYVYGYLRQKECMYVGGKLLCSDDGSAKRIVSRISTAICGLVDKQSIHTAISYTISMQTDSKSSTIRSTVERIEKDTNSRARKRWETIFANEKPYGIFVAKIDVSEIPIQELHNILPILEEQLLGNGYGIYSIDYTRDFSGTLDRQELVDYLVQEHDFREQGDFASAIGNDTPTILDNTDTVGKHVCTWISTHNGYTTRTKLYNKIVSNFEAGEVREQFGGHLADYADCPNEHLRKTFLHPDVQNRGCTRIEISLYACSDRTPEKADYLVDNVLQLVSPKNTQLFVEQPAIRQWENLAKILDRCFVLGDRPNSTIYVCWYAHTKTRRISGIRIAPTAATIEDDKRWNKAIEWAICDFGFRNCPIFHIDILAADDDGIQHSKLRCYTKNAKTILAACRRPVQLHKDAPNPNTLLPPTNIVEWEWRTRKCSTIGIEKSAYSVVEVPHTREFSVLSTRNRERRLQEIEECIVVENWKKSAWDYLEQKQLEHQQNIERREQELEQIQEYIQENERHIGISNCMREVVEKVLSKQNTQKIAILADEKKIWSILGYRLQKDKTNREYYRIVVGEKATGTAVAIWPNTGIQKLLSATEKYVEKKVDKFARELCWFPRDLWFVENGEIQYNSNMEKYRNGLDIRIQPAKEFYKDKQTIRWNPIDVVEVPDIADLPSLREIALDKEFEELEIATKRELQETTAPNSKEQIRTLEIQPGTYICKKYATTTYRGNNRTILFLVPKGEDGEPTTDEYIPAFGHFLEKEIERIGGVETLYKTNSPLLCYIGAEKTTTQRKKDRIVSIVATKCTCTDCEH